ncbi:hypothetical protein MPSI1_002307 [Malassezia psittaci]|uniref:DUF3074 domain-containing protein n=1 Tax=Malassezia psittaci TaxID=1821823 RepID=A0AAF0FB06_9BASI|nr:hypothetical protein MPSI1_002307 [Malassezia psittaci]
MHFEAKPMPRKSLPTVGSEEWNEFLKSFIRQGFAHVRQGQRVSKKPRSLRGEPMECGVVPSDSQGRLSSAGWHTRTSRHQRPFEEFSQGLYDDHTKNEREYIEDLKEVECLETFQSNVQIWNNRYRFTWPTANRDFIVIVFRVALPPHPEPFSEAHEELTMGMAPWLPESVASSKPQANELKSFMVLSQPVSGAEVPKYLRSYYSSIEAVRQLPDSELEWLYV